jgi:hypothetical protein
MGDRPDEVEDLDLDLGSQKFGREQQQQQA